MRWHSSGSSRCIGASIIAGFEVGKFTFGAEINYQVCLGWDEGCSKEEGKRFLCMRATVPKVRRWGMAKVLYLCSGGVGDFPLGSDDAVLAEGGQQQRTGAQPQRTYEKQADQWFDGIFVRPNQSYRWCDSRNDLLCASPNGLV